MNLTEFSLELTSKVAPIAPNPHLPPRTNKSAAHVKNRITRNQSRIVTRSNSCKGMSSPKDFMPTAEFIKRTTKSVVHL